MKPNISHVKPTVHVQPVLVCGAPTSWMGCASGTSVFDPCRQSHQPGLQGVCQPSALSGDFLLFHVRSMARLLLPLQLYASG